VKGEKPHIARTEVLVRSEDFQTRTGTETMTQNTPKKNPLMNAIMLGSMLIEWLLKEIRQLERCQLELYQLDGFAIHHLERKTAPRF